MPSWCGQEAQGTRGQGLSVSLGPFLSSTELLLLDLPVTGCERLCSLGSFASSFSFATCQA